MGNSDSKISSPTCNSRREKKTKSIYTSFSESFEITDEERKLFQIRWRESTLSNPLEASKTAWPVSHIEAVFLPEFKIKDSNTFNFELLGTIAKGAFGKVYKVGKVDNNEVYAMKVLSKAQIISENAIQQVKDEVRIQSMCGHNPFIVNCPYFWQTRKKLFIVSNFVSGGELLSLCQSFGSLPEELVAIYVAEIALALDFLHNSGVIYRDLKLENVLLDEEGHTQIIDFGLAKWLPYNRRTSTICGTLQYMAPEILSLESGYGHAVDWWSLGVLTCVLITSKFPPVVIRRMAEINQARSEMHVEKSSDCTDKAGSKENLDLHSGKIENSIGSPENPDQKCPSKDSRSDFKFFNEEALTPSDVECSDGARDLIQRLLNSDPQKRLRSLLSLQNIRFYKDFDFASVRTKKISPREVLLRHYPDGPKPHQRSSENVAYFFEDFDSIHI